MRMVKLYSLSDTIQQSKYEVVVLRPGLLKIKSNKTTMPREIVRNTPAPLKIELGLAGEEDRSASVRGELPYKMDPLMSGDHWGDWRESPYSPPRLELAR